MPSITGRFRELLSGRAQSIVKGSFSNVGSRIVSAFVGFITVPLGLHYLGPERYGVWATVITTTSWIAVLELGVSDTLMNHISIAFARGDQEMAARHTANALAITLSIAAALGLLFTGVWPFLNWMRIFNVSGNVSATEVQHTMAIALVLVLITPLCTLISKVLAGYQQIHIYSGVTVIGSLGSLVGMYVGVHLRLPMPILFLCVAGSSLVAGLLALLWTLLISKPWLRPRFAHLNLGEAKALLSTGSFFFIIQIAGIIVFNTDNLVVGHYLGAAEVTPYSVTMRLVGYAQLLPSSIFPSLWPAYAEANERNDVSWIRRTYSRALRGGSAVLLVGLGLLVLFGRTLIHMWAGPAAVPPELLLALMAVWTFMSAITSMQSCLLGAVGRVKLQGVLSILAAVLNLVLSIYLVQRIGPAGAVLGTVISYLLVLIFPQTWDVRQFFREAEARPARMQQA